MTAPERARHNPSQIEERAKAIWKAMVDECVHKGLPHHDTEYGKGYYLDGALIEYARACWPGTNFRKGSGKTAMNLIRQFLRSTGNVVLLPYQGKQRLFVRARWAYRDSIPVLVGVPTERQQAIADHEREQRSNEAKITPVEAGETLPAAPVEQRKGQIISNPAYGKGTPDSRHPNIINFTNGHAQCTICNRVFEKRTGISSHVRMHAAQGASNEVVELRQEVERLRAQALLNLGSLDSADALELVNAYVQMLKDECARLTTENEALKAQPTNDPDSEARLELIKEVLTRVQKNETSMFRGLADINDALEG